ncbi:hypothetical protein GJAV_G00093150 [Gymnothorax javanicus]|nr:hypothetical protein GJAV_G00093150 [Gymnothorax javanicus]
MMIKMKLPMRTAEEGGDDTAEEEQEKTDCNLRISSPINNRFENSTRGLGYPLIQLDKEAVFEWFGLHLNPAKRIEFMCGLLHMCQPLELRFLGSCLEDLARKDFHVLRDFETRANSPSDLGLLTDVTDPVVRSKLCVCLSLLGSENRECAGILFRILSHVDSALYFKNYDFNVTLTPCRDSEHFQNSQSGEGGESGRSEQHCGPPVEPGSGVLDQLALLFTMASLHPAFPFHQRETVRIQLDKVSATIEGERQHCQHRTNALPPKGPKSDYLSPSTESSPRGSVQSPHAGQPPARAPQREARNRLEVMVHFASPVYIERIVLKGISRRGKDKDYSFEVKWSDSTSTNVSKTHHELEDFLLKVPKERASESFERSIRNLLRHGDQQEGRELERTLREKFLSAPQDFRQTGGVCSFFLSETLKDTYSHCTAPPSGRPGERFKEDCSETSSQEDDLETYIPSIRKRHGSKSPSLNTPCSKSSQGESRKPPRPEHNGAGDWRRGVLDPHSAVPQYPADDKRNCPTGNKSKGRALTTDREKGRRGDGWGGALCNGLLRPPFSAQKVRPPAGKDGPVNTGSGPDTFGETSSESYSSPSSPQHEGRESLESEDEDDRDRDTDSNSDDFLSCKALGGSSLGGAPQECTPAGAPKFPPLPVLQPVPFASQNGVLPPAPAEGRLPGALPLSAAPGLAREPHTGSAELEKPAETAPLSSALTPSLPGPGPAPQPIVQRFKTGPSPQAGAKGGNPTPLPPPMGAISVIAPGPAYLPSLQLGYPAPEPPGASVTPTTEPAPLPPPSFSVPTPPAPVILPLGGATTAPAPGLAQAPPLAVPTPPPSPAPTPSPAFTHSTAHVTTSADNSAYISTPPPQQPQQQQQTPHQPMGCGACGCRGSCGSGHMPGYFFPPQLARQVFGVQPLFPLTSLCSSGGGGNTYLSQALQNNGSPAQLSFFPYAAAATPLLHPAPGPTPGDAHVGFGLQQMAAFGRFYPPLFPPSSSSSTSSSSVGMVPGVGVVSGVSAGGAKKNGNVSCYNCGVSGHIAQDCKQPSIDATHQGGFRLKYVAPHASEGLDKME